MGLGIGSAFKKALKGAGKVLGFDAIIDGVDSLTGKKLQKRVGKAQARLIESQRLIRGDQAVRARRKVSRQNIVNQANIQATNLASGGSSKSSGAIQASNESESNRNTNLESINRSLFEQDILGHDQNALQKAGQSTGSELLTRFAFDIGKNFIGA